MYCLESRIYTRYLLSLTTVKPQISSRIKSVFLSRMCFLTNFQVPLLLYSFFPCSVFVSRFVLIWLFFSLCLLCAQPQIQEDAVMGEINSLIVHLEQITKRPQSLPPDINIFHLWKSLQVSCIKLSSRISKLYFRNSRKDF